MTTIRLSVLGPPEVAVDDVTADLPPRSLSVLAALALRAPRAVAGDDLVTLVWGDEPPKSARASLYNAIAQARSGLGDDVVITEGHAYRLGAGVQVDAAGAVAATGSLSVTSAPERFVAQLERWSVEAYPTLHDTAEVVSARAALRSAHRVLHQRWAGSLLAHDRPAEAVALLRSMLQDDPGREVPAALLAVALFRTGDPVEAVRVLDAESTGDSSRSIDSLRTRILSDDDRLRDSAVVDEVLAAETGDRPDRPVVGRSAEIELIRHAVGQGAVIVRGEGGAGKTAVVMAAEPDLPGVVVRAVCSAVPTSPYSPVLDVLEQLLAHDAVIAVLTDVLEQCDRDSLRWAAPPLAPWLGPVASARPELRREQVDRSLIEFFDRLGSALSLTVVVDDYHRSPRTSQQLLSSIAGPDRVRLVIATRPDPDLVLPVGVMVDLRPLSVDAVADLVGLHLGTDAAAVVSIADELVQRTGGNAFFVESMIHHSAAIGAFRRHDDMWVMAHRPGLPVTVEAAVIERLDELSRAGVQLVEYLAISSEPMNPAVLATIDPRLPTAVSEAIDAGVVDEGVAGVQVAHELVSDAVQATVSPVRLIDLHDELAEAFEASDEPNRVVHIARHRYGARSLDPGAAVSALRAAGELERERSSAEFAIEHFQRARAVLDAPGTIEDLELAVHEGLARRDAIDAGYVDVLRSAAEGAIGLGAYELAAQALIGLGDVGQVTTSAGGDPELIALVERTLTELTDPVLLVRLRVNTLAWFAMSDTWRRPQEIWRTALADAEALDVGDLRWEVLRHVDWGVDGPDQLEQRLAVGRELIAHGEATGDHLSTYRGHFAAWGACVALGDHADLVHHHESIHALEPRVHGGRAARLLAHRSAGMALIEGRLEDADVWLEKSTALPNPFSPGWDLASMATVMLPLRLEQARAGELVAVGQAAAADQPDTGVWQAMLTRCAFDAGDLDLAAQCLATVARNDFELLARDQSFLGAATLCAAVAVALDERLTAAALTRLLAPYGHLGVWCGQGSLDPVGTALAQLAIFEDRVGDAAGHVVESLAVARRLNAPLFAARALGLAHLIEGRGVPVDHGWSGAPSMEVLVADAEANGWVALARDLKAAISE